jgi:pimeloyl-ACP methyl ester carboxylesterase
MTVIEYTHCARQHWRAAVVALLLQLLLITVMAITGVVSAKEAHLNQAACWFDVPKDRDMKCGHLWVPENRGKQDTAIIKLSFVVFEPDRERHEPVVYLTGGPGQTVDIANKDDIGEWWSFINHSPWLRGRRLIVMDQRGVGLSEPSLSCSAHHSPHVWSAIVSHPGDLIDSYREQRREIEACRDDLMHQGIDLTAYNTRENAADFHDLRIGLNIEKWVLFGISYGTKVALQILANHPAEISAVILDSTLPLDVDYIHEDAASLDRALKKLDNDCSARAACADRSRSLTTLIAEIMQLLDANPLLLRLKVEGQAATFTRVSGDDFIELLYNQFYDRDAIETLPDLIRHTADQDYQPLAQLLGSNAGNDESLGMSDGMNLSVVCNDGISVEASHIRFPLLDHWAQDNFYDWACPLWPTDKSIKAHKPVKQDNIPVLLLSGAYDPATPTTWAEIVARNMRRSQLVSFEAIGHDVIDATECGGDVVSDFLANPDAKIRTACLDEMAPPQFHVPEGKPAFPMTTVSTQPMMLHR